jgi:N-acetylglucosaminyl-diphospho-decaprenol L-rhamnosyltransferase
MRPDVSIVVVTYNAKGHLSNCLSAVADSKHEVIVVDNGSVDGTAELVRSMFPSVRLVQLEQNLGFGVANNEGMRRASGRYFLLLNSDAWPVEEAVDELVSFADRHPQAAIVGPRILNPDGSLQLSVRGFPTMWRLATELYFLRKLAPRSRIFNAFYGAGFDYTTARAVEWLKAVVLLVRREAVEAVGAFDPAFFIFSEETDLCFRLHTAGWSVFFCPTAEFVHLGGASTRPQWGRMHRELLRSELRYFAKHGNLARAERARRMLLWACRLRGVVFRGERATAYRAAAGWLGSASAPELLLPER